MSSTRIRMKCLGGTKFHTTLKLANAQMGYGTDSIKPIGDMNIDLIANGFPSQQTESDSDVAGPLLAESASSRQLKRDAS